MHAMPETHRLLLLLGACGRCGWGYGGHSRQGGGTLEGGGMRGGAGPWAGGRVRAALRGQCWPPAITPQGAECLTGARLHPAI